MIVSIFLAFSAALLGSLLSLYFRMQPGQFQLPRMQEPSYARVSRHPRRVGRRVRAR